MRFGKKIKFNT